MIDYLMLADSANKSISAWFMWLVARNIISHHTQYNIQYNLKIIFLNLFFWPVPYISLTNLRTIVCVHCWTEIKGFF
jgi:hypothetical protein